MVALVGEGPGQQEDDWGYRPFCGQAGKYLDSLLFQSGLSREVVYATNVVHCRPPNNRTPKPAEVQACSKWLDIELGMVQPQIIIALGATAIARFLGPNAGTVEHLHGKPIEIDGRIILPAYHPAAALHDTDKLRQCQEDFDVLRGLVKGHPVSDYIVKDEYPNPVYTVVDTDCKMKKMLDEVHDVGECAIDTETVARGTELWSMQVSAVPGTAWFVPMKKGHKSRIDVRDWGAIIIVHYYLHDIEWLDIPDGRFVDSMTQAYLLNLPQGLKELASRLCGIRMVDYREVVRPGQLKLSLAYLDKVTKREWPDPPEISETKWDNKAGCVITRIKHPWNILRKVNKMLKDYGEDSTVDLFGRWFKYEQPERNIVESVLGLMPESTLADIPFQDAVEYACRDALATLRVKRKMDKLITDIGLNLVLKTDLEILPMVRNMMNTGMAVDPDYLRSLSKDYDARLRAKATELAVAVGHPFNPNSSPQVATVIYNELGFKPTAYTETHEISTDDAELKKTGSPIATGIIAYRGLLKLKSTYADSLAEKAIPDGDGVPRVHTTLKTTRVETGRLSSSDPNLQNIPTRNKEAKAIKNAFVAPEGKKLGEADYSQIEMVTLAHLSNCKRLVELFNRGGDPHTEMAARIFDVPLDKAKQDKYRYPVKRLNFGVAYLIGAQGLSSQINEYIADLLVAGESVDIEPWDEPTCQRFLDDWYKINPEVKDFQEEMVAMARRLGYVKDVFGRLRFIPEVNCPIRSVQESGRRMAANMPVTSSAQEIIKAAMGQLWRELPNTEWYNHVRVVMQIHDSLVVEITDDESIMKPYFTWMRKVMTSVVQLRVPIKADIKVGYRWAETEKYQLPPLTP